ncbi:hypothetical protein JKP88DRAFT_261995 [Tribonema minus]|uniref:Uncharacterized protein n=1 Tax=Tribonema minus TaxID=303371 RepID=A0A836CKZ2_9STRA|nr:hypothetical protein JKP88DRAFT_261995 [Tribonema minus]
MEHAHRTKLGKAFASMLVSCPDRIAAYAACLEAAAQDGDVKKGTAGVYSTFITTSQQPAALRRLRIFSHGHISAPPVFSSFEAQQKPTSLLLRLQLLWSIQGDAGEKGSVSMAGGIAAAGAAAAAGADVTWEDVWKLHLKFVGAPTRHSGSCNSQLVPFACDPMEREFLAHFNFNFSFNAGGTQQEGSAAAESAAASDVAAVSVDATAKENAPGDIGKVARKKSCAAEPRIIKHHAQWFISSKAAKSSAAAQGDKGAAIGQQGAGLRDGWQISGTNKIGTLPCGFEGEYDAAWVLPPERRGSIAVVRLHLLPNPQSGFTGGWVSLTGCRADNPFEITRILPAAHNCMSP